MVKCNFYPKSRNSSGDSWSYNFNCCYAFSFTFSNLESWTKNWKTKLYYSH